MKKAGILFLCLAAMVGGFAQKTSPEAYITLYKDLAISEMIRTGVPASITLAQGIHESESGNSELVKKSNNHFGIKCKSTWTGGKVYHDDDARGECFRKYDKSEESYRDHSDFLKNNPRYASLFTLVPTDYRGWAYGLKKAGYATNPQYAPLLVSLVERYNLGQYDLIALNQLPDAQPQEGLAGGKPATEPVSPVPAEPQPVQPKTEPVAATATYPEGVFYINETRVVYAAEGTSMLALAQKHQVELSRLLDFNDLDEKTDILPEAQLVFLQRKRKQGAIEFHTVKTGETLYTIAQAEGIRFDSLLELNHLDEDAEPAAGEKLYLRSKAPAAPRIVKK